MNATVHSVSLAKTATALKLVAVTQSLLWFACGYAGLYASIFLWISLLCSPLLLFGRDGSDSQQAPLFLFFTAGAFACIALLARHAAERWRRLRWPAAPIMAMVLLVSIPLLPLCVGWLMYIPGILGKRRLKQTRFADAGLSIPPSHHLAELLQREHSLESSSTGAQKRAFNRATAVHLMKSGGLAVLVMFVGGVFDAVVAALRPPLELAIAAAVTWAVVALGFTFFLASRLTQRLHDSRSLLMPDSARARECDKRAPVLLLRSFDDEWKLDSGGRVTFFSASRSVVGSLEEHLTDRLWRFGPVIAFRNPEAATLPIGAAREDAEEWQTRFDEIVASACSIVLILGHTPGVAWELGRIFDRGLAAKLLIVVPPWIMRDEWIAFFGKHGVGAMSELVSGESRRSRLLAVRLANDRVIAYRGPRDQFGYEALSLVGVGEIIHETMSSSAASLGAVSSPERE